MKLSSGLRVAAYEVLAPAGAGGMGEVYRARDTRLGREVALKVLPEMFSADPERLARFEREAQVLAALSHPNIAAIYGLEEWEGNRILVLEFVPGETLAERLSVAAASSPSQRAAVGTPPLQLDEALGLARQITEGLGAAHGKGIIHRDLKPANIKVTPEGKVKILDFGLAKDVVGELSPGDLSKSPTLTAMSTREGSILGTAAYMSPEQARGKRLDKRTDIWSFACILYELLSGHQTFSGETVSDTLVAVLKGEPDWQALPATTPPGIRRLLRRCLEKDPARRLHDIADARFEIEDALAHPAETAETSQGVAPPRPAQPRYAGLFAALILVVMAAVAGVWFGKRQAPPPLHWAGDFLGGPDIAFGPRVSPDGRTLAFQAMVGDTTQVAVMDLQSENWAVLTHGGSNGIVTEICWSKDGSKLYFDRYFDQPHGIYSVARLGGEERLVLEDAASPAALPDGSLLAMRVDKDRRNQIIQFWPETGRIQPLKAWPQAPFGSQFRVFADGREAVFFGKADDANTGDVPHLYALDFTSGRVRLLARGVSMGLLQDNNFALGVTPDGGSVLFDSPSGDLHQIVSVPRDGTEAVRPSISLTALPHYLDVGPDGSIFADQVARPLNIIRFPVAGGMPERVGVSETYPSGFPNPVELPDGRFLLPSLLSGRARMLAGKPGQGFVPLVDTQEETGPPAVLAGSQQVALMVGTGTERTIALISVSDGRVVRRLNGAKGASIDGLAASPDGKTLYYSAGGTIWSIPAADGTPQKVHAGDGVAVDPNGRYLVIWLNERAGNRLIRYLLPNGPEQSIPFKSDVRVSSVAVGSTAIRKDGKILVSIVPTGSWFFRLGLLDPATGSVTRIPVEFQGDIDLCGWSSDGRILCMGLPFEAHLWRFRPVK